MKQWPSAMRAADAPQIGANLPLQFEIGHLTEIMHEQNIFRRNGGVRFEFENPVAVRALEPKQRFGGPVNGGVNIRLTECLLGEIAHAAFLYSHAGENQSRSALPGT